MWGHSIISCGLILTWKWPDDVSLITTHLPEKCQFLPQFWSPVSQPEVNDSLLVTVLLRETSSFLVKFFNCVLISCLLRWPFPWWFHRMRKLPAPDINSTAFALNDNPCRNIHVYQPHTFSVHWVLNLWTLETELSRFNDNKNVHVHVTEKVKPS